VSQAYVTSLSVLQVLTAPSSRYYTISLILGTVALAYGSVPLYKMVRPDPSASYLHSLELTRIFH